MLPADQARAVEAHVLACDRCSALLDDAERVRSLLLSDDPGPVPADVWHRIEAALATEAAPAQAAAQGPDHAADTAAFRAFIDAPATEGVAPPPASTTPIHSTPDHGAGFRRPLDDDGDGWTVGAGTVPSRARPIRRVGGSPARCRADPRRRRGPPLLAAAAVLAVLASRAP